MPELETNAWVMYRRQVEALNLYPKFRRWMYWQKAKTPFYQFATWAAWHTNTILMRFGFAIVGNVTFRYKGAWSHFRIKKLEK